MPDKYDPYREALVVETSTVWPDEFDDVELDERQRIAESLHADPASAQQVTYVRMHTGFCREISVTGEDIQRAGA